jgi:hypothetical protein
MQEPEVQKLFLDAMVSSIIILEIEKINIPLTLDKFWMYMMTPPELDEEIEFFAPKALFAFQNASTSKSPAFIHFIDSEIDMLNFIFYIEMTKRGDRYFEELLDDDDLQEDFKEIMRRYTRTNRKAFKDVQLYTLKDITKWLRNLRQRRQDMIILNYNIRFPQRSSA